MKEQIKVFGVAGEIFEESLVPYLPRILSNLQKLLKEDAAARLHNAISETLGQLVLHVVDKLETLDEQKVLYETQFLRFSFSLIEKQPNKLI
mmetsp:Transcript_21393/g.33090  ORF Transcript_21393/g.33090 Transcript_21393/m.33090 type:complete len:92 (-) Transcript_21393:4250-4525(-)